ncbi:MAG: aminotransferase class I/II-fold pyridoxal phosphate-dependent enzyme [Balneolales bacterium]|nr:aminotransferase class I/II-fold pyridoxal phosphate-dependent enzyme [Balneolales bacterium]
MSSNILNKPQTQVQPKIWLSSPHMGGQELDFIHQAFESNWIAPLGPNVDGFEKDICSFTNSANAAVLTSGTAAIHLALVLAGVKEGDEVLCQSFTFSASANPITYCGATPVFIDSEKKTWNICPEALEVAIKDRLRKGRKPAAVIYVHLYGMPALVDEIQTICDNYGIPLIEDAAEALGSEYKGEKCGTFGFLSALSFNGNKIITTSGGGALLGRDAGLIAKARFLATQARDQAPHYQHSHIGYNYRMSNISAGIGRGQMLVLKDRVSQRRANFERYRSFFAGYEGIQVQTEPDESFFSNRWLSCILVDPNKNHGVTREIIRLALEEKNIEARPLWKPMHMQPVFSGCAYYGSGVSEQLFEQGLCLPSGSNLEEEDFTRIFEVLKNILN